ncbi:unnamed protein product [Albugo candida]|uniref:Uncharacterized protein n=1 Tax=Albugo candida TaxID=65357 RepID=A0A024G286_9STRA|nr:unnamed protein product [Albugo candida]|eukprot:CCI40786.1 unnamed protein product [Albugo candida]
MIEFRTGIPHHIKCRAIYVENDKLLVLALVINEYGISPARPGYKVRIALAFSRYAYEDVYTYSWKMDTVDSKCSIGTLVSLRPTNEVIKYTSRIGVATCKNEWYNCNRFFHHRLI